MLPTPVRTPRLLLPVLAFTQFIVAVDYNIVLVALPDLRSDLGMSQSASQWVVSAYALAFGGLLLLGGRMADLHGRRRILVIGITLFALGSLLAAVALDPVAVLAGRALQGAGGATLVPAVLATIGATFDEGPRRFHALAAWSSAGAVGLASGSALGGVLMAIADWRIVFAVLVPLSLLALIGVVLAIPADGPRRAGRSADLPGGLLAALGVAAVVFALAELPRLGLDPLVMAAGTVGILLLVAFVLRQRRAADPLLDLRVFRFRTLSTGLVLMVLFMGSIGTSYYVFTIFLQDVLGRSALVTGLAFVPWGVVALFGSSLARRMLTHLGVAKSLALSFGVAAIGTAGLAASITPAASLAVVIGWTLLLGAGQAMGFASLFAAAGIGVPTEQQGVVSALMSTVQQIGTALGLALLVGLATAVASAAPGDATAATASGLSAAVWAGSAALIVAVPVAMLGANRRHADEAAGAR